MSVCSDTAGVPVRSSLWRPSPWPQGASSNVDQVLTRVARMQKAPRGALRNKLICLVNLVAGAGFEPAAFRL